MKELIQKNRSVILYLVFGVCTTLVNIVSYWMLRNTASFSVSVSTIIAWVLSVLFAYVTNRKWVFESKASSAAEIAREMVSFFAARISTGILDWAIMLIFAEKLKLMEMAVKIASNVIVIILNYVLSRWLVFKER